MILPRIRALHVLLATCLFTAGIACSSTSTPDAGPTCQEYQVPAGTDLTTPTVSFKTDLMPLIQRSCAFTSCHGASSGNLKLTTDAATSRASLVGVAASIAPTFKRVEPGNPSKSFIMRKLDGDICLLKAQCNGGSCGDTMPQGNDLLDVTERDRFRRWIAQGAADN